jgi:hypothetical protein
MDQIYVLHFFGSWNKETAKLAQYRATKRVTQKSGKIFLKLPFYTPAGFDLTTHSFSLLGVAVGDDTTPPGQTKFI